MNGFRFNLFEKLLKRLLVGASLVWWLLLPAVAIGAGSLPARLQIETFTPIADQDKWRLCASMRQSNSSDPPLGGAIQFYRDSFASYLSAVQVVGSPGSTLLACLDWAGSRYLRVGENTIFAHFPGTSDYRIETTPPILLYAIGTVGSAVAVSASTGVTTLQIGDPITLTLTAQGEDISQGVAGFGWVAGDQLQRFSTLAWGPPGTTRTATGSQLFNIYNTTNGAPDLSKPVVLKGFYTGFYDSTTSTGTRGGYSQPITIQLTKRNPVVTLSSRYSRAGLSTNPQVVALTDAFRAAYSSNQMEFYEGTTLLARVPVADTVELGGAGAALPAGALGLGSHTLTAKFVGSDGLNNSTTSSEYVVQIVPDSTSATTLSVSSGTVQVGTPLTFTATVTGSSPDGRVTLKRSDLVGPVLTANLSGSGNTRQATFNVSPAEAGQVAYFATYEFDGVNAVSVSANAGATVTKATSSVAIDSTSNPVAALGTTSLTATVTGYQPSGTVIFKDGSTTVCEATLVPSSGTAIGSCQGTFNSLGSKSISAEYSGDLANSPATASPYNLTVIKAVPAVTLASATPFATTGAGVALTAGVSGLAPTGTVTFRTGSSNYGPVSLSGSSASYTVTGLTDGQYNFFADYSGDSNNTPASSPATAQKMGVPASSTRLVVGTNPIVAGGKVRITGSVTGNAPSGLLTFLDGSQVLGTQPVAGPGPYWIDVEGLSAGLHALQLKYSGDANNSTSLSNGVVLIARPAPGPQTQVRQFGYDTLGRPKTETDPRGNQTKTLYDELGRPYRIEMPAP